MHCRAGTARTGQAFCIAVVCLLIELWVFSTFTLICAVMPQLIELALAGGLYDRFDAGSYGGGDVEYQSPYANQDRF